MIRRATCTCGRAFHASFSHLGILSNFIGFTRSPFRYVPMTRRADYAAILAAVGSTKAVQEVVNTVENMDRVFPPLTCIATFEIVYGPEENNREKLDILSAFSEACESPSFLYVDPMSFMPSIVSAAIDATTTQTRGICFCGFQHLVDGETYDFVFETCGKVVGITLKQTLVQNIRRILKQLNLDLTRFMFIYTAIIDAFELYSYASTSSTFSHGAKKNITNRASQDLVSSFSSYDRYAINLLFPDAFSKFRQTRHKLYQELLASSKQDSLLKSFDTTAADLLRDITDLINANQHAYLASLHTSSPPIASPPLQDLQQSPPTSSTPPHRSPPPIISSQHHQPIQHVNEPSVPHLDSQPTVSPSSSQQPPLTEPSPNNLPSSIPTQPSVSSHSPNTSSPHADFSYQPTKPSTRRPQQTKKFMTFDSPAFKQETPQDMAARLMEQFKANPDTTSMQWTYNPLTGEYKLHVTQELPAKESVAHRLKSDEHDQEVEWIEPKEFDAGASKLRVKVKTKYEMLSLNVVESMTVRDLIGHINFCTVRNGREAYAGKLIKRGGKDPLNACLEETIQTLKIANSLLDYIA